jgi:hypothetical protein
VVDVSGFAELDGGKLKITDARLLQTNPTRHYRPDSDQTITSVAEVHALGPEEAGKRVPVHVLATVTYINPATAVFFVQDQTGATYVVLRASARFKVRAGDLVDDWRHFPVSSRRSFPVPGRNGFLIFHAGRRR